MAVVPPWVKAANAAPPTLNTSTVAPADVTMAPKLSDKITSGLTYAGTTGAITAAPFMNSVMPGINPHNVGGPEVSILGDGILVFIQALQVHRWYDRNKWGIWSIILLSTIICLAIWWHEDPIKGILNTFATMTKAFQAFGPLSKLGVLAGQTEAVTATTEVIP